ncbi:MAG: zinc ribbon domain-containing protein [Methanomicrobiales archaeon]|nr:zinc ribbon domain-containing protein [Methanomicrobiales archaeon]
MARTEGEAARAAARADRWQVMVGGALPGAGDATGQTAGATGRKAMELAEQEAAKAVTAGDASPSPGEPRRCRACGHAVGLQARYCGRCGSAVSPVTDSRPPGPVCPSCGKAFQPGERFCSFCGVRVQGKG